MLKRGLLLMFFVLGCYVPVALAADASVAISSPKDGNILSSMKKIKVKYKATLGETLSSQRDIPLDVYLSNLSLTD